MTHPTLFTIDSVTTGYVNSQPVIENVSLQIAAGEFIGIIGPNGAGKTTLLRSMCGLIPIWGGNIQFQGRILKDWPTRALARQLALVQQIPQLNFDFTVRDIVQMGRFPYLRQWEWERPGDHQKVDDALGRTDCQALQRRRLSTLSGGERQRVMLARALAQEPQALFLDEPTTHLDIHHQVAFFHLLQHLNKNSGLTIIAILHDLNHAALFCDRLILLKKGCIYADGKPAEILTESACQEVYEVNVHIQPHPQVNVPQVFLAANPSSR